MRFTLHDLARFPKERPSLTPAHERLYIQEYTANRRAKSGIFILVAALESWMHRAIAGEGGGRLLEIGAGTLNHIPYEHATEQYDIVEPFTLLYRGSPHTDRVSAFYERIEDVPMFNRYDRIISVAVLEHIEDLPGMVARTALVLAPGGQFEAGIPTEGGWLWGLAWRCTTGIAYRLRTGLDYGTVMRHEHINTAKEIEQVIRTFYKNTHISRFPLPWCHASLYSVIKAEEPDLVLCRAYLDSKAAALRT